MRSISRSYFLKDIGLAGLGIGLVGPAIFKPTKASAKSLENELKFYVPELDGTEYDNQLIEVFDSDGGLLASGTTTASRATFNSLGITEIPMPTLEKRISAYYDGSQNILKFPLDRSSNVKITMYDLLGREVKILLRDRLGKGNYEFDFSGRDLASGRYFLRIETDYNVSNVAINVVDGGIAGFNSKTIDFDNYVSPKGTNRNGSLAKALNDSYKVVVSDNEAENRHYIRTFDIDSLTGDIEDRVAGHVSQEGVTPELFKDFCEEANFRELWGYTGLKTIFGKPDAKYWISSHHYDDGATATAEEQAYVKGLIENEIFPNIKESNRPSIYVEDPTNPEELPIHQDGVILVMPINSGGFYVGPNDEDKDGIIDWASVYLSQGQWNDTRKGQILEELLSPLAAPNEVSHFSGLTVLISGGYGYLTEIDKKLIKICENYQPKEQISNILGL